MGHIREIKRTKMKNERIGSLFSGIGGVELGFRWAGGFTTEWFIEWELYPQTILKKRFPNALIYDDVTQVDFKAIPKVDILTGGFPCQDISNAGKRAGIEGSRSSLWSYYCEAIRIIRPRIALIENVSALLNRGLNTVLSDLASVGYDAEWHCIPASAVGANHQRDRIFIISYPCEIRLYEYNQFEERHQSVRRGETFGEFSALCDNLPNTNSRDVSRLRARRKQKSPTQSQEREFDGCCKRGYWKAEPKLGRVAHGVPNRVDRIKCLGNAVVPQVAEVFAKAIKEKFA